jgi:hypothetical protein
MKIMLEQNKQLNFNILNQDSYNSSQLNYLLTPEEKVLYDDGIKAGMREKVALQTAKFSYRL